MNELISIIMGAYNCEETIDDAVQSILNQTYDNWEFIICDDGSTDSTFEILKKYAKKDSRIKLLKNSKNCGLPKTLNICLDNASGKFIARMDGDDVSLPNRFEKEVEVLRKGKFAIVSTWMNLTRGKGEIWGILKNKEFPKKGDLIISSPISHPASMFTRDCILDVKGYRNLKKTVRVEDVDLWIRLYQKGYRAYNIQEPLYNMWNDEKKKKRRKYKYRINSTLVRLEGCRRLKLPFKYYLYAFKPMILGLIPSKIRFLLRKRISGSV